MNTYTKLKDGNWGVRVIGPVKPPQVVSVKTKAGATKQETVTKVIWSGPDRFGGNVTVSLCAIAPKAVRASSGSSEESWRGNGCSDCKRLQDWCKRCAFDEFDN